MPAYNKPFKTLPEQLQILKDRGLQVKNDTAAIECLHRNGYYRLSAYWYLFRKIENGARTDNFLSDSWFEDARDLYVFDKDLKLLLLDAIERVEIAVRVEIALVLGKQDPFAHTDPTLLDQGFATHITARGQTAYDDWNDKFNGAVIRSKDEFITHYEQKYGSRHPLPIWIAIELWDFGMMSRMYGGLKSSDKDQIAARFGIPERRMLESWLRHLNYIRNVIAHHGRLWNLNITDRPRLPRRRQIDGFDELLLIPNAHSRVYATFCILCHFSRIVNPLSSWPFRLGKLLADFPSMPHAHVRDMGVDGKWRDCILWQK